MLTKKIYIHGMHCHSCEKLLTEEFLKIKGVRKVKIDYRQNAAEISYQKPDFDFNQLNKVAEKFGYQVLENISTVNKENSSANKWIEGLIISGAIFLAYWALLKTGILNKIHLPTSQITLGLSFLIGLAASVSSCLAVVGAVILAFGQKYQTKEKDFMRGAVKPNLLFHLGRIGTFFFLGGILGLIGGRINIGGNFVVTFTIIIAIIFLWLGLNILELLPPVTALGIKMPRKLTSQWARLKYSNHSLAPFILGGLSFFLPCGFTQSMQIFALASGSFLTGALSLTLFALGTMPVLLLLGITAAWVKNRKILVLRKAIGFVVVIFALFTLQAGLALKGINTNFWGQIKYFIKKNSNATEKNLILDKTLSSQTAEMHVTNSGFEPNTLNIENNVPVKFIIKGDQLTGCTSSIIIPSLKIYKTLAKGDNLVEFTPHQTGSIPFSCGMGMVRGEFIVN
jgi:sulfite exporter TauE/SafE/copper chaperone CopZ